MFSMHIVLAEAMIEIERYHEERELIKKLSPEEQTIYLKMRKKEQKKRAKHRRKMQIAREGRSLNFWGNR